MFLSLGTEEIQMCLKSHFTEIFQALWEMYTALETQCNY